MHIHLRSDAPLCPQRITVGHKQPTRVEEEAEAQEVIEKAVDGGILQKVKRPTE